MPSPQTTFIPASNSSSYVDRLIFAAPYAKGPLNCDEPEYRSSPYSNPSVSSSPLTLVIHTTADHTEKEVRRDFASYGPAVIVSLTLRSFILSFSPELSDDRVMSLISLVRSDLMAGKSEGYSLRG